MKKQTEKEGLGKDPHKHKAEQTGTTGATGNTGNAGNTAAASLALSLPDGGELGLAELLHSGNGIESPFMRDIFLVRQAIVGTRYLGGSDELVEDLVPGSRVSFVREPENRFDSNAVMALDSRGRKLGYMPRRETSIIGALLNAGKYIYGIVPYERSLQKVQSVAPGSERTPYSIWVDLYMREFTSPEDLSQIPRQGWQGSYAVADFTLSDKKDQITSIFAVKVINGKERDIFRAEQGTEDPEEYREAIARFEKFAGFLPLVGHDIAYEAVPVLEEAYGVQLGKAFSNQVIDTMQMAANHLPWIRNASLEKLTEALGIEVRCDTPGETRCRAVWKLYCRMERSELERQESGESMGSLDSQGRLDETIEEYPMSDRSRRILRAAGVATLRELSRCSEAEAEKLDGMDDRHLEELRQILVREGAAFRPEGTDKQLWGYPEEIRELAGKSRKNWEYLLLFGVYSNHYNQLWDVRGYETVLCGKGEPAARTLPDVSSILDWAREKTSQAQSFMEEFEAIVSGQTEKAVGPPGSSGNASAIIETAEDLITLYKKEIRWKQEARYVNVPEEYRSVPEEIITVLAEGILAGFDEYCKSSRKLIESLTESRGEHIAGEETNIEVTIPIHIDMERLRAALKILT